MNKIIDKIKKTFLWFALTNLGRMIGSLLLFMLFYVISFNLYNNDKDVLSTVFLVLAYIFGAILAGHFLVMLAYGWVINPVRDYCRYKGKGSKFCKIFCKKCEK